MRFRILFTTLALAIPVAAAPQATRRVPNVERFEVSRLPTTPTSDLEREIFMLLRIHKKGDLMDASRIHARLGQYYKERGEGDLSDACNRMAVEAWSAASGERPASAGAPGSPPFDPANTISSSFMVTDTDLGVEHLWDFFDDGTWAHVVTMLKEPDTPGPREVGWYSINGGRIRLWQMKPRTDRTLPFELLGDGGKDGLVLDGAKMAAVK